MGSPVHPGKGREGQGLSLFFFYMAKEIIQNCFSLLGRGLNRTLDSVGTEALGGRWLTCRGPGAPRLPAPSRPACTCCHTDYPPAQARLVQLQPEL